MDSAQQIIAEVGPTAATFPSEKCLSSWVGACPGDDESAGVNHSHRSPKGNRHMRRLLNQAANAAARTKGSLFEIVYRRSVPRLGHNQAIGAIAHRQCRLIWHDLTFPGNGTVDWMRGREAKEVKYEINFPCVELRTQYLLAEC